MLRTPIHTESLRFAPLNLLVYMRSGSSVMKAFVEYDGGLQGNISDMASSFRFTVC